MSRLLSKIKAPNDVKKLAANELPELCDEIREEIISTVADNGGHLASNLGVVELTVALHRVFTLPEDCIVWDVGHQSYAHKLLTGREEAFSTLRREDGLSGFPSREESDCDPFTTGHSSASISSALGLSVAKALAGDPGHVIAVIGDGALTGGLAYEGLNNAGRINRNMIVILNDNAMSISRNVGSIARYLSYVRAKPGYLNAKDSVEAALCRVPKVGEHMAAEVRRVKNQIKKNIFNTTIFQDLGFNYYGPFDGHDLRTLTSVLTMARDMDKPVLIHIRTYKGRGYKYAENAPSVYHGLAAFDREKGAGEAIAKGFSHAFGETMCTIAGVNEKLCAVTAAMESGTGLTGFREKYRSRFFDVGIAEEHAVTFCAGLARGGMIPVFAVYSRFYSARTTSSSTTAPCSISKLFWPWTEPAWSAKTARRTKVCSMLRSCAPCRTSTCTRRRITMSFRTILMTVLREKTTFMLFATRAAKSCIARKTTRFPASRFMCSARRMLLSRL